MFLRTTRRLISGSHVDFASHVASYALGEDWWVNIPFVYDVYSLFNGQERLVRHRHLLRTQAFLLHRPTALLEVGGGERGVGNISTNWRQTLRRTNLRRAANPSCVKVESFTGWDELDTNNFYSQASKELLRTSWPRTHCTAGQLARSQRVLWVRHRVGAKCFSLLWG